VLTGWFERPNWELRLVVTLWKVTDGKAKRIADAERTGKFEDLHRFLGEILVDLAKTAKWKIPAGSGAALAYRPGSGDHYAFSMFGRGLGHLVGVIGPKDPVTGMTAPDLKAAQHDLERGSASWEVAYASVAAGCKDRRRPQRRCNPEGAREGTGRPGLDEPAGGEPGSTVRGPEPGGRRKVRGRSGEGTRAKRPVLPSAPPPV
jgi:hypothetical protein